MTVRQSFRGDGQVVYLDENHGRTFTCWPGHKRGELNLVQYVAPGKVDRYVGTFATHDEVWSAIRTIEQGK